MGVGADRRRSAGRDDRAIDHDGDAVGEREHGVHVMLDEEDRETAAELGEEAHDLGRLGRAHPGHRLVEQ